MGFTRPTNVISVHCVEASGQNFGRNSTLPRQSPTLRRVYTTFAAGELASVCRTFSISWLIF